MNWRDDAIGHAEVEYPRESCGLLIAKKRRQHYVPCCNLAARPGEQFIISPQDYAMAEESGEIVAVIHSHPNAQPTPSQADRVACEASGLPWHIVGYPNCVWAEIQPIGYKAPLIGREFVHGVLDCYSIVRDWYAIDRGITLPNFDRHDDWWKKGLNLYLDSFAVAGFVAIDAMEVGSVLLMQILSDVPNHAAIYLGDNIILHHLHGRLSSRDVYGGYYRKHTTHTLRYVGTENS